MTPAEIVEGAHPVRSGGRVLILLDGSRLSRSALDAAAEIALARDAEVLGIFVEEVNLLRSAGYGFAREVGGSTGLTRPLDTAVMEARLRSIAEQVQRSLEQVMAHHGIAQALKLCRGWVAEEVLNLVEPDDLVVMGRVGWSGMPGARLGSSARVLIRQAPGDVLLWADPGKSVRNRVVVLLNHDQGANHRAVRVGAELAKRSHQPLTVLIRTETDEDKVIADELRAFLREQAIEARVKLLPGTRPVTRALREEGASQLVISRQCRLFGEQGADVLADLNLPITITP